MTIKEFHKQAKTNGYHNVKQFDNPFTFMNFCYKQRLTDKNSICYIKPNGQGCYLTY